MAATNNTYSVPECNLDELTRRIDKLNKRARKLGSPEITISKAIDHVKARCNKLTLSGENSNCWELPEKIAERNAKSPGTCKDTGERMAWWTITITGDKPVLNGWEFVAILEPMVTDDGATLNLISCLPGQTCPTEYREIIGQCDHCKVNRRRTQTFVVHHAEQGFKCVGRQCIKDFLGYHADPHTLASLLEMLAELGTLCEACEDEEWLGGGCGKQQTWDLKMFLTLTAARIRLGGWLSKGQAFEQDRLQDATANVVLDILDPPNPRFAGASQIKEHEELVAKHPTNDKDVADAEAAIEWAKSINAQENDYLANVNLVARVGSASRKVAGIAASILPAYYRAVEQEMERNRMAARPESNWIGGVGKRIDCLEVKVEKVIGHETEWGFTNIHKMTDVAGNDLTWFASNGVHLGEGTTYFVAASVKSHGEFKGRKQTVLTRVVVCVVWTEEGLAAKKAKEEKKAARAAKKLAKV